MFARQSASPVGAVPAQAVGVVLRSVEILLVADGRAVAPVVQPGGLAPMLANTHQAITHRGHETPKGALIIGTARDFFGSGKCSLPCVAYGF